MSRIGKKVIEIPTSVKVDIVDSLIKVSGPLGSLETNIRPEIGFRLEENVLSFYTVQETKEASGFFGLSRTLVDNMILGVTKGFEKKLELVGVGYRVKMEGTDLVFSLGFSHPIVIKAPNGIKFEVEGNTNFTVKGIDKILVGQVASNIRKLKKPEPYKGKGIKYIGEIVRRKAGKSATKGK
jgi:large subunit ribosomal protein L6